MKTTIFYKAASMLLAASALISCDDTLDVTPQDKLTPETFFKDASQLEMYTNKFYGKAFYAQDIYMDPGDINIPRELDNAISCQRYVTETSSHWNWERLRDINFFLENSGNCPDVTVREKYDGIARFFRAFFYLKKLQFFGDVPWYDTALGSDSPELYKARDPRELVIQNILADLDYAAAHLTSERTTYSINRWTALALKSRACLFEGTFRKYHGIADWQKYLKACAEASDAIMKEGGYTIYNQGTQPYAEMFRSINATAQEYILAIHYDMGTKIWHDANKYVYFPGNANHGATARLAKIYLMKDGSRFTDRTDWQTLQLKDEVKDRDPRMSQTLWAPGYTHGGERTVPDLTLTRLGYQQTKFIVNDKNADTNGSDVDLPVFRYAEVRLNFAEAKAELGTITQDDIDRSIKLLRNRVNMPNLKLADANSNPDAILETPEYGYPNVDKGANKGVILEIRRERTIELAFEGLRYNDLMRWKEGAAINQPFRGIYIPGPGEYDLDGDGTNDVFVSDGSGSSTLSTVLKIGDNVYLEHGTWGNIITHETIVRNWNEERDYFYYIPSKDRILNPQLTQNPGWNDGLGI